MNLLSIFKKQTPVISASDIRWKPIPIETLIQQLADLRKDCTKNARIVVLNSNYDFVPATHANVPRGKSIVPLTQREISDLDTRRMLELRIFLTKAHNADIEFCKIA